MYKTILVSLNNFKSMDDTLAVTSTLARRFNSHVIGLYVIPPVFFVTGPYGIGGGAQYADLRDFYLSKAAEIEEQFNEFVRRENFKGEWRQVSASGGTIADMIINHGREADLIMLGHRPPANSKGNGIDIDLASRIIMESGRPVFIVPDRKLNFKLGSAMIGWDTSKESTRAAFDAMSMLKQCDEVSLLRINPGKHKSTAGDLPGAEMAATLARHDVNVTTVTHKAKTGNGESLLDASKNSDFLVMGAYGHNRMMERLLGGATSYVLEHMDLPVLMSN